MCQPIQFPHYDQIALAGKSECTVLIDRQHASGNGPLCPAPRCGVKGLKDMILQALDDAGGQQYLVEQAHKNPTAFMTLLGKVLPLQVSGAPGGDAIVLKIVEYDGTS